MHTALGYAAIGENIASDEAFGAFRQGGAVLAAVCDGSGPHGGGEVAARLAIRTFAESFQDENAPPASMIQDAVRLANRVLFDSGRTRPSAAGRSVSAALVSCSGGRATLAHVGDARVLLVRAGEVRALTRDHTVGNLLAGDLAGTPESVGVGDSEARSLARALGRDRDVPVELQGPIALQEHDVLVLATAGLHGVLTDRALADGLGAEPGPAAAALIERARGAGASCGSVVILRVCQELGATMPPTPVPEVERPADMLTPSSADLELVARLTSEPRAPRPIDPPRTGDAARRAEAARARAQEQARQRVLLGAIIGMSVVAALLLLSLILG